MSSKSNENFINSGQRASASETLLVARKSNHWGQSHCKKKLTKPSFGIGGLVTLA